MFVLTRRLFLGLIPLALFVAACSESGDSTSSDQPTEAPKNPQEAGERFLNLWQDQRYEDMYDLLSDESQLNTDRETFISRYEAIADEATITGTNYSVLPQVRSDMEELRYTITIHTTFFGDITETNTIPLVEEETFASDGGSNGSQWRVQWSPSLIFRALDDRSLVHFFTRVPSRGAIYDRDGNELAVDGQLAVVGVVPDLINDTESVISALSELLELPIE